MCRFLIALSIYSFRSAGRVVRTQRAAMPNRLGAAAGNRSTSQMNTIDKCTLALKYYYLFKWNKPNFDRPVLL